MAALTGADIVDVLLDLDEKSLRFKIGYHSLSRLVSVHARVLSAIFLVDSRVVVHNVEDRQIVTKSDFVVVRVVSGSYLNYAGTEIHLNILIRDNRDLPVCER